VKNGLSAETGCSFSVPRPPFPRPEKTKDRTS